MLSSTSAYSVKYHVAIIDIVHHSTIGRYQQSNVTWTLYTNIMIMTTIWWSDPNSTVAAVCQKLLIPRAENTVNQYCTRSSSKMGIGKWNSSYKMQPNPHVYIFHISRVIFNHTHPAQGIPTAYMLKHSTCKILQAGPSQSQSVQLLAQHWVSNFKYRLCA